MGGEFCKNLYVNKNLFLTCNKKYKSVPGKNFKFKNKNSKITLLAVFGYRTADLKMYTHVYENTSDVLNRATTEGKEHWDDENFQAKWVLVVTWLNMELKGNIGGVATIQMILVTDFDKTFVRRRYMRSTIPKKKGANIIIGFQSSQMSEKFSYSAKKKAFDIYTLEGNVKNPKKDGNYLGIFQNSLSDPQSFLSNPERNCWKWYDKQDRNQMAFKAAIMPPCPANYFFTFFDRRWRRMRGFPLCVYLRANFWFWPATKTCCYNWWFWSLIMEPPRAGHYLTYHPFFYNKDYRNHDETPYTDCCQKSDLCHLYYEMRPVGGVYFRFPFFFAWLWGDPHITTIDGRGYTFNGLGEYTMLSIEDEDKDPKFTYMQQARTGKALTVDGDETKATIFTAFAGEDSTGAKFQVELNREKNGLDIWINDFDITKKFSDADDGNVFNENTISVDRDNKTAMISLQSGVNVNITLGIKMLTISVSLLDELKGKTKGLLGTFDGNDTNDFILPDGTILGNNLTDRMIFENFGEKWKTKESSSIFTYHDKKKHSDFYEDNFEPIFLDEEPEEKITKAKEICGENIPCIFDYIQTKDESVAKDAKKVEEEGESEKETLANENPKITSSVSEIRVEIGVAVTFNYTISDDESAKLKVLEQPENGFTVDEDQQTVTWTPEDATNVSISLSAIDNKDATAASVDIKIILCNNCSDQGTCNYESPREATAETPLFRLASCRCNSGYEGDDCEADIDGCKDSPCTLERTCTDVSAALEKSGSLGYTCGDCPEGYTKDDKQDCNDIDECEANNGGCSDNCTNTEGSFECECPAGSRLKKDGKTCIDINECIEGTHDCQHTCNNTEPGFACICLTGYRLKDDGKSCDKDTPPGVCADNVNDCEDKRCTTGADGKKLCFCLTGYELNENGKTCKDTNECDANICLQNCNNTVGSYICFCNRGFKLSPDKVSCTECDEEHWGEDCANECNCVRGECDPARGCVCDEGWEGTLCDKDVNECEDKTICGTNQECKNTPGSYTCNCIAGFTKLEDGTCEDQDECDDPNLYNCPDKADCVNVVGSYSCKCWDGYKTGPENTCVDVNECETASHGCEHICKNLQGSYTCDCESGFGLQPDRKQCEKVKDPCPALGLVGCEYGCREIEDSDPKAAECFCQSGYYLGTNKKACLDIDECESDETNKCSNKETCGNIDGGYVCSCPSGQFLEYDGLTCTVCDKEHYGKNCEEKCDCSPLGSEKCDPVQGCKCKAGWTMDKCDQDIDECITESCQDNAFCKNTPGSFQCLCNEGFSRDGEDCKDINECTTGDNICDQKCNNNDGSYTCSCNPGFQWSETEKKCQDIDECATNKHDCQQDCTNTPGSYRCSCYGGFELNAKDRRTCTQITQCTSKKCEDGCQIDGTNETCFCNKGRKLEDNEVNCTDINECEADPKPCEQNCSDGAGTYTCSCNDGFELNEDQVTCRACPDWRYKDCTQDCSCNKANSKSCDKVTGVCSCKSEWKGDNCDTDINECLEKTADCPAQSECKNKNNGYTCECQVGYFKTGGVTGGACIPCDSSHFGKNCDSVCTCHKTNSESCRSTDGFCTCKEGWNGTTCDTDVKECDNTTNPCADVANSHCTETEGSYVCNCDTGYRKTSNGSCIDIDECLEGKDNCDPASTICTNTDGNFTCPCVAGFSGTGNNCEACVEWKYGLGCNQDCSCVKANAESCHKVTGNCTCKTGYEGDTCETNIDECTTQNITCPANSQCRDYIAEAICECDDDRFKRVTADTFVCEAKFDSNTQKKYKYRIKFLVNVTAWVNENENDANWKAARDEAKRALTDLYRNVLKLFGFVEVFIVKLTRGSLDAEHDVKMNDTGTSDKDIAAAVQEILTSDTHLVTFNGEKIGVGSITYTDPTGKEVELTPNDVTDKCTIFVALNPCPQNQKCYLVQQEPQCMPERVSDNIDTVIGLGVGIPVFLIVCLIIAIIVIYNKRMHSYQWHSKRRMHDNLNESYGGNAVFSNVIPTKFDSHNRHRPFFSPSGWDTESEMSRDSDETLRRGQRNDGFSDVDQYRGMEPNSYDNSDANNFSWDFMYRYFDPRERYEIKRPATDSEANPVFRSRDATA